MDNWITVLTMTLPQDTYIVQGYLASEGIESQLKDELTAQVYNFYSNAIGGVKIQVKESDYEKARLLLQKGGYLKTDDDKTDTEDSIEVVTYDETTNKKMCPFCQSANIGKKKEPNSLSVFVYFILGVLFPIFRKAYKCFDCGKEWKFKKSRKFT
jgi:hypothetical protein